MIVDEINNELLRLSQLGGVDVELIGESELGQPIYTAHVASYDGKQFIIEGAIHAREYVTSYLLLELIRYYRNRELDFGIYFVPLVNPDGARLVLEGVEWIDDPEKREFLIGINGGSTDFSLWKANANAVDLNVNFDADWGLHQDSNLESNLRRIVVYPFTYEVIKNIKIYKKYGSKMFKRCFLKTQQIDYTIEMPVK